MAVPGQRDPRARRWTIVLVLLALVVVAGVALRVVDDRRADADRAADRAAERRTAAEAGDEGADDPDAEPAVADEPEDVPRTDPASSTDALAISLQVTTDLDGDPATFVQRLGPLVIDPSMTLPAATTLLGEPDTSGPSADDELVCAATWLAWGIEARFYFGHPPSPDASCAKGPIAAALLTGERWHVEPLTGDGGSVLAVQEPEVAITSAFPGARRERLSPGLASLAQADAGWLLAEGSYGGDPFPTLYAITVDGAVASFLYVSGAD